VFDGPSVSAAFAAVVAEFNNPISETLPSSGVQRLAAELLPAPMRLPDAGENGDIRFPELVARCAAAAQDLSGPTGLEMTVSHREGDRWRVCLGFHDVEATKNALRAGLVLADALFRRAAGIEIDTADLKRFVGDLAGFMTARQPAYIALALIRVARQRGIPAYRIVPGSRIFHFGQGAHAFQCLESATHRDSFTGRELSRDKGLSNRVIRQLGFPGVTHKMVTDLEAARRAARQIGYPVVVKPPDRGRGHGVVVGINGDLQLEAAFAKAKTFARSGRLLIERFVEGNAHRLSVFSGKLMRASELTAAHVIGDGTKTVAQLIEEENRSRSDEDVEAGFLIRLKPDADMEAMLARQGFSLKGKPPRGVKLRLRDTSNLHTGGTLRDVTSSVHPENVAMAEAIARGFRLDAIGIDFITPDIARSWRDVDCAVIEVNTTPGIGDELAERIMLNRFPAGTTGRIPSILIVEGSDDLSETIVARARAGGKGVGHTGKTTTLDGWQRFREKVALPDGIMSLLLDPACEVLVVSCSVSDLVTHGIPHTRFDLALAPATYVPDEIRQLIASNSGQVVEHSALNDAALASVLALAKRC
jgi:cyanophycin synthetase